MPDSPRKPSRPSALKRLADRVLEAPGVEALSALLTRALPEALGVTEATLLLWDRKLESFESLSEGETRIHARRPGDRVATPEARYLISDGQILETPGGGGDGALLPLMARSGLAGMLVLGPRRRSRRAAYRPAELRLLSLVATRSALALENHLYQRELIATERMAALGTMAGMLAHDFRGPMTVIRGYAEAFLAGDVRADELKSRAQVIVRMIDRLERMTSETLDFAKGGGRVARRGVTLTSFLDDLASGIAQELPGLDVVRDFGVPETAALLDVDKLRRAVGNVAANARDAMGGRGRFHMGARLSDGCLVLTLGDEGPGVPPALRDTLFEPFVTQGKKGGTGLGLAVARRFVEDHDGVLELLPEGPGARFKMTLPLTGAVA